MFIDIHAHAYRSSCPPQDGKTIFCTPEDVLKRYNEHDISRGVLLPLIGPEVYLPQSNEDILDMCEKSAGRFVPFCNIDPRGMRNSVDSPFNIWLEHYKRIGCKGVGELMPNLPFMNPLCQNLFRHIENVGLPLIFDISYRIGDSYGFYDDLGLPQLEFTLKRFPKLIILGHGVAFWSEIGTLDTPLDRGIYPKYPIRAEGIVPTLFRRYPNMHGDLSANSGANALMRDPDYAVKFLNEFQDRLYYGTDICRKDQPLPLVDFLLDLRKSGKLSESAFMKIARGNAIRLLGIED